MGRAQEASISFDSVRDKNVMQLRKLNTAIFPVTYQDKFYTDALTSGDFTKLGKRFWLRSCKRFRVFEEKRWYGRWMGGVSCYTYYLVYSVSFIVKLLCSWLWNSRLIDWDLCSCLWMSSLLQWYMRGINCLPIGEERWWQCEAVHHDLRSSCPLSKAGDR